MVIRFNAQTRVQSGVTCLATADTRPVTAHFFFHENFRPDGARMRAMRDGVLYNDMPFSSVSRPIRARDALPHRASGTSASKASGASTSTDTIRRWSAKRATSVTSMPGTPAEKHVGAKTGSTSAAATPREGSRPIMNELVEFPHPPPPLSLDGKLQSRKTSRSPSVTGGLSELPAGAEPEPQPVTIKSKAPAPAGSQPQSPKASKSHSRRTSRRPSATGGAGELPASASSKQPSPDAKLEPQPDASKSKAASHAASRPSSPKVASQPAPGSGANPEPQPAASKSKATSPKAESQPALTPAAASAASAADTTAATDSSKSTTARKIGGFAIKRMK